MNADDFQRQLDEDKEYQELMRRQEEERQKRIEESKKVEAPFIEYLHQKGFVQINSIGELTKSKDNTQFTDIILEWLPKVSNKQNSQQVLVRALAVTKKPFDGKILMQLFDDPLNSENLKWAIGNTIASASVNNISGWLEDKLTNPDQPMENQMLVYAAMKYFDREKAKSIVKSLIDKHPLQSIDALGHIGNSDDLDFLLDKRKEVSRLQRTAMDKAIKKIRKKSN